MRPVKKFGWGLLAVMLLAGAASGCATAKIEAMQKRIDELEERTRSMERGQGRVMVKFEDVENQLELLTDRVETNRLALERRGSARELPVIVERPEGYYNTPGAYGAPSAYGTPDAYPDPNAPPTVAAPPRRYAGAPAGVATDARARSHTRIHVPSETDAYSNPYSPPSAAAPAPAPTPAPAPEASHSGEEHVTITMEDYDREFGGGTVTPSPSPSPSPAPAARRPKRRQAPVVKDERLTTAPVEETLSPNRSSRDVYKSAIGLYRQGDYNGAFVQFERYLSMSPPRDYLDNAYYWLGECSYGMGDYQKAIGYFDRVLKEVPEGNKVPDAMLKAALAYAKLGDVDKARTLMNSLISTYPTTNAANIASKRLTSM